MKPAIIYRDDLRNFENVLRQVEYPLARAIESKIHEPGRDVIKPGYIDLLKRSLL